MYYKLAERRSLQGRREIFIASIVAAETKKNPHE
jgi:hypothetical protein